MDESTSMDILQNTYINAYKNLDTLKEPKAFLKWLNVIATNEMNSYLRKNRDINLSEFDSKTSDIVFEIVDESLDYRPEEQADQNETRELINKILYKLPETQRIVIMMFYFEELLITEIAEILNISENTVKSRLRYAKQSIEKDVIELEKTSDIKLYGFAPIAFFAWYLKDGLLSSAVPEVSSVLSGITPVLQHVPPVSGWTQFLGKVNGSLSSLPSVAQTALKIAVIGSLGVTGIIGTSTIISNSENKNTTVPPVTDPKENPIIPEEDNEDTSNVIVDDSDNSDHSDDIKDEEDKLEISPAPENKPSPVPEAKPEPAPYKPTQREIEAVAYANKTYDERAAGPFWNLNYKGMKAMLIDKGFSEPEASYGTENSKFDWKEELRNSATYFNSLTPKSEKGLLEDLKLIGVTGDDAIYAINNIGIDWKQQPFKYADYMLSWNGTSRYELYNFLLNAGKFTQAETDKVMKEVVVDWQEEAIKFAKANLGLQKTKTWNELVPLMEEMLFTTGEINNARQAVPK